MQWTKKIIYGFLIGVLLFTPLGWWQARHQLLEFSHPYFLQIPLWVPFAYGLCFLFVIFLFPFLEKILTATFTFDHRFIFWEFIIIILVMMMPVFTESYPFLILFIFSIYIVARFGFFHAKWDWLFFLIGALLATTVEMMLTSFNLYHYSDPDFWELPFWVPFQWGIIAMSCRRIAYVVEDLSRV
ncbi:MAG: hypothetical protein JNK65_07305 [Deltaproteobacteria bacterium]|nr:hypothetical protein [Deltaproteobacteria bacterium]